MARSYEAIVLGLGGMGSAALYHLARRGVRVLGLEQFGVAHDRGSSHGETRIIRRAYFEHPDYVPLIESAFRHWHELEARQDVVLFRRTGLMLAGDEQGAIISGVRRAARTHRIELEQLTAGESRARFDGLSPDDGSIVLFEPGAGLLFVERCVAEHIRAAENHGAIVKTGVSAVEWRIDGRGVRVRTGEGWFLAENLVITAGAWSDRLLRSPGLPLEVRRKVVVWFNAPDRRHDIDSGFPIFGFDTGTRFFFGFPAMGEPAVKTCDHYGGQPVPDPSVVDRTLQQEDVAPLRELARRFLPGVWPEVARHSVCMYTMTPDEHFIIDRHPESNRVVIAAGFSGHGFKFASVVGSILADFVTIGRTTEPIDFLGVHRDGLTRRVDPHSTG